MFEDNILRFKEDIMNSENGWDSWLTLPIDDDIRNAEDLSVHIMNEWWTEFSIWYGLESLWQLIRATEFQLSFTLETLPQRAEEINQQIENGELDFDQILQHQMWLSHIQNQLHNLNNRTTRPSANDYNDGWNLLWRGWEEAVDQTIISLDELHQTDLIINRIAAWEELRDFWSERISTVRHLLNLSIIQP